MEKIIEENRMEERREIEKLTEKLSDSVRYLEKRQSHLIFLNEENVSGIDLLMRLKNKSIKIGKELKWRLEERGFNYKPRDIVMNIIIIKEGAILEEGSFLNKVLKESLRDWAPEVFPEAVALLLEAMPREQIKLMKGGHWATTEKEIVHDFDGDGWPVTYYNPVDREKIFRLLRKGWFS